MLQGWVTLPSSAHGPAVMVVTFIREAGACILRPPSKPAGGQTVGQSNQLEGKSEALLLLLLAT